MNQYALFAGDTYYPNGGFGDFRNTYDTPEEALKIGTYGSKEINGYMSYTYDWYQVVDLTTLKIIHRGFNQ